MLCFLEVTAKLKRICFIYGYRDMYFVILFIFPFCPSAAAQLVDALLVGSAYMLCKGGFQHTVITFL